LAGNAEVRVKRSGSKASMKKTSRPNDVRGEIFAIAGGDYT